MDLNSIASVVELPSRALQAQWREGDAWLGGGTWLLSEPQTHLRRLIDLRGFGWQPLHLHAQGLEIAATCTFTQLLKVNKPEWTAATLFGECCRALLGSFKVWNEATVGGNLCLSLPAGPMIALTASLDGVCTIWTTNDDVRLVSAADFVTGPRSNALGAGELLRSITLPVSALRCRTAFRRISLVPHGPSAALLIGRRSPDDGSFVLTVTASTDHPVQFSFPELPGPDRLSSVLEQAIGPRDYCKDVHGTPQWRRHMTLLLAEDIRRELADQGTVTR